MTTRRLAYGLAVTPEKDLALFADMAARGQRLVGFGLPAYWVFEDAQPEDAVFAVDYAETPSEDYLALFEAAGWQRVLNLGHAQIFKASPGTRPIHTDPAAQVDALAAEARNYGRWAAVWLAVVVAVILVCAAFDSPAWLIGVLFVFTWVPFTCTAVPWLGTRRRMRALRRRQ